MRTIGDIPKKLVAQRYRNLSSDEIKVTRYLVSIKKEQVLEAFGSAEVRVTTRVEGNKIIIEAVE